MPRDGRSIARPLRRVLGAFGIVVGTAFAREGAPRETARPAAEIDSLSYVADEPGSGRFALVASGTSVPIVVASSDYLGVQRAVGDLRADIERVSGIAPRVWRDTLPKAKTIVVVGTLGRDSLIDHLVRAHKLDVSAIAGRWETFLLQTVSTPFPGVDQALVIVGSDKRGTIFGIYDLSAQIGVSPWYWWADVPVAHRERLYVLPGPHSAGEPAVKYRGIFFNDEAPALSGWARATFGGINHAFYEKAFELILRMKGNYLWPAMWGNAFADDDSISARLADEFGVVMGTSHHEPMTRAQQEWRRYGSGPWNYEQNDSTLRAFWRAGIQRMGGRENIVTTGMRGDGDMPMTQGSNIALLERIVADQRKIIGEVTKKDPAATPQLWALYKEVQDYYERGMRVPDDVTLLFADDNWGNVRRLPGIADAPRAGGYGIYYHFDYVGGPRNYKWINTNQIARVWEQMHLSYEYGARRIWIVNVGDLKPMEFPTQFFLDYAWNPNRWPADRLPEYTRRWAAQQFGATHAAEIAEMLTAYTRFNSRRKPELLAPETYSLASYREAETVVAEYNALLARGEAMAKQLPARYQSAFYELVLHPIQASANLNELYVTVAKNRWYAQQGRAATNDLADHARTLFERDAAISRYYNSELAGGKWNHMMDQTHIGYTYWQEPPRNSMPRVDVIQLPAGADMGVSVEGERPIVPGGGGPPPGPPGSREIVLPEFDPYLRQTRSIDLYNRGQTPFAFRVQSAQPWVVVTPAQGSVDKGLRISVAIDWTRAPVNASRQRVPITIVGPTDRRVVVTAVVHNPATPSRDAVVGFVASEGVVSIEAEHFARAVAAPPMHWQRIPDFGRTLSGVTLLPVTASSQTPGGAAAHLEYPIYLFEGGAVDVEAYLSPSLNFSANPKGLRYAVSFDDEPPIVVNSLPDTTNAAWDRAVSENIRVTATHHQIAAPGAHVLNFWAVDPALVLQKLVVAAPGAVRPSYLGPPESYHRLPSASPAPALPPASADPRFDWFVYDGHDSVYTTLKPGADDYLNPIVAGFYPDPSMMRVGDDYYLAMSSFAYFPGVPLFHSKDLVHWTQIGHVLDRPSQLPLDSAGISRGIFAPVIRFNAGTYYMITTLVDRGGNFFVTARDPRGPWSDPVWLPEVDGIDPSFFFDDNGKAYVLNNGPPVGTPLYEGHRAIWMQEFDVAAKKMVGPRTVLVNGGVDLSRKPIWIEAPHIFKRGSYYYLICAEGGTADQHSEVVFRSTAAGGPFTPYSGNPILTQRHLSPSRAFPISATGHADFVETQNGEWWAVFLGTRPYEDDTFNTGRETFLLPVRWVDGWPLILSVRDSVPYVHRRPNLPAQPAAAMPTSGNFTVRDDFDRGELAPYWNLVRTPHERWYDLTAPPGWLTLRARPADLSQRGQASFIGRRQQHARATASTSMQYRPARPGDRAGLVAFQNDAFYYFLGVTMQDDGRTVVEVEQHKATGGRATTTVLASQPAPSPGPIYLRVEAKGRSYDFYYGTRPDAWTLLAGDADGTLLSTRFAGGFVGAMLAMYAYTRAP